MAVVGSGLVDDRPRESEGEGRGQHEAAPRTCPLAGGPPSRSAGDDRPGAPAGPERVDHQVADQQGRDRIAEGRQVAAARDGNPGDEGLEARRRSAERRKFPASLAKRPAEETQTEDRPTARLSARRGRSGGRPQRGHEELAATNTRGVGEGRACSWPSPRHTRGRRVDDDDREDDHAARDAQLREEGE